MRTQLTPAEYWEWRTTISELETARAKLSNMELQHKLMLYTSVQPAQRKVQAAQEEYTRFKAAIEEAVGQSINGKVIDDITFEIKELPKEG